MYLLPLFAEEIISKGATDPASWATLADKVGPMLMFAIVCLTAFFVLVLGVGWIAYRLGSELGKLAITRFGSFLDGMEISAAVNAKSLEAQTHLLERMCEKMGIITINLHSEDKEEKHDEK